MFDDQLHRIRTKLQRAKDEGVSVFGSETHRFELHPPPTDAEVDAWESTWSARIPDALRAYLTRISGGGAGPYYGLYGLRTPGGDEYYGTYDPEGPAPTEPGSIVLDPDGDERLPLDGTLAVSHHGCGHQTFIVLKGPLVGRMVQVNSERDALYVTRHAHFLDWYERWLDDEVFGSEDGFEYGPPGDAEEMVRLFFDADSPEDLRIEATVRLSRMASVGERAAEVFRAALEIPSDLVRGSAIDGALAHGVLLPYELLEPLLSQGDIETRRRALKALMSDPACARRVELDRLLDDDALRTWVLYFASSTGALTREQAERYLESPDTRLAGEARSALKRLEARQTQDGES